ncbi:MAG: Multi-copper polyphenol oxidoreductase laccase [Ignavibacteria bacterium]|nr:Multi-copper polyphenol oxidoreductase laccase [Ignavibacteria bacterium]
MMNKKIECTIPEIFPKDKIICGVTHRNIALFPGTGLSLTKGKLFNDNQLLEHRKVFAQFLDVKVEQLKFQKQGHESHIRMIDENSGETESDGMITNIPGLILNIGLADCCAVLVFDIKTNSIGAFHSGWRSTKENISGKGIIKMKEEFGSQPENLLIYLSPCASAESYEVGEDLALNFPNNMKPLGHGKYLLDLRGVISNQLLEFGVMKYNIESSTECTITNLKYHSYRRDKDKAGRMSAFIGLITNNE